MRNQKALIAMLHGLVKLLSEEADSNPQFADKLDALLSPLPSHKAQSRQRTPRADPDTRPDIYAEFASRGESAFMTWLRDQPAPLLRSLIRRHDFDATRRTAKWKDTAKLSTFIADQIRSRLARGSGFLTTGNLA
jgi:hypothetical protein